MAECLAALGTPKFGGGSKLTRHNTVNKSTGEFCFEQESKGKLKKKKLVPSETM